MSTHRPPGSRRQARWKPDRRQAPGPRRPLPWRPSGPRRPLSRRALIAIAGAGLAMLLGAAALTLNLWRGGEARGSVTLVLDPPPPPLTLRQEVVLRGEARGLEPKLTLDGVAIPVREGRFEHRWALREGENSGTLRLSALPGAGAAEPLLQMANVEVTRTSLSEYDRRAGVTWFPPRGSCTCEGSLSGAGAFACKAAEARLEQPFELPMRIPNHFRRENPMYWRCDGRRGLEVDLHLEVSSGVARAVIIDPAGQSREAEAHPGAPAHLTGRTRCRGESEGGYVRIEPWPPDSEAGGASVEATLTFLR